MIAAADAQNSPPSAFANSEVTQETNCVILEDPEISGRASRRALHSVANASCRDLWFAGKEETEYRTYRGRKADKWSR